MRVIGAKKGGQALAARQALTLAGKAGASKKRVGTIAAFFMLATAITFDALQFFLTFIPFLGVVINIFITVLAAMIFWLWFLLLGVSYFSGKKMGLKLAAAMGGLIVELVPIIDALPAITVGVTVVIIATRLEDAAPSGRPA